MDHRKTLTNMSPLTRRGWSYLQGRKNRRLLLTLRVTSEERDAIRAAADWEDVRVSDFLRAAIATRARDGYCKAQSDIDREPAAP